MKFKIRNLNTKINIMKQIGKYVYKQAPTGDWLKVGKIVNGIDTDYIEWYAQYFIFYIHCCSIVFKCDYNVYGYELPDKFNNKIIKK